MMNLNNKRSPLKRRPLRLPGQSDEEKIRSLQMDIAFYAVVAVFLVFLAFFEWWCWYRNIPPQPILAVCLALIFVPPICYKVSHLLAEKSNWELGRQGEIEVGQSLEGLRSKGYYIFHDIQCNAGGKPFNIDHVIVSPHGIFAVETKTPRKPLLSKNRVDFDGKNKITIAGRPQKDNPIQQAIRNAQWLSGVIPYRKDQKVYPVIPVVVYPGWFVIGPHVTNHVWVLNPKLLQWEIPKKPQSLTEEDVIWVTDFLNDRNRQEVSLR